jgi:Zn-dependent peptidase ImmA (M78 family)
MNVAKIKQARVMRGLSLSEVAGRLIEVGHPLTKAALSKYETGKSLPRQSTLMHLARIYEVRVGYFLAESAVQVNWAAFRKRASLSKAMQAQVQATVESVVEGQVWLEEALNPTVAPRFPKRHRVQAPEDAEGAAEAIRKEWRLEKATIESVMQIIEDNGGIAVAAANVPEKFDGLSGWANKKFPVLVSSGSPTIDRRRYNFAHELGHLAMNCEGLTEAEEEKCAHRFAAALLVPAAAARYELGQHRQQIGMNELAILKKKYGLSMQAWTRRAHDLGIIPPESYRRLCIQFSQNGWRKNEPVQFVGLEEPVRLRLLALRAVAEGLITPSRASELCPGLDTAEPATSWASPRASEIRKMPQSKQDELLSASAAAMESDYVGDPALKDFEAFGQGDLHDNE